MLVSGLDLHHSSDSVYCSDVVPSVSAPHLLGGQGYVRMKGSYHMTCDTPIADSSMTLGSFAFSKTSFWIGLLLGHVVCPKNSRIKFWRKAHRCIQQRVEVYELKHTVTRIARDSHEIWRRHTSAAPFAGTIPRRGPTVKCGCNLITSISNSN